MKVFSIIKFLVHYYYIIIITVYLFFMKLLCCSFDAIFNCPGGREVRQVSSGPGGLWAVIGSGDEPGVIGLRCGVTDKASSGVSWSYASSVSNR